MSKKNKRINDSEKKLVTRIAVSREVLNKLRIRKAKDNFMCYNDLIKKLLRGKK